MSRKSENRYTKHFKKGGNVVYFNTLTFYAQEDKILRLSLAVNAWCGPGRRRESITYSNKCAFLSCRVKF